MCRRYGLLVGVAVELHFGRLGGSQPSIKLVQYLHDVCATDDSI